MFGIALPKTSIAASIYSNKTNKPNKNPYYCYRGNPSWSTH